VSTVHPAAAPPKPTARLLIWCPDRTGIIAATTRFLADRGANIIDADQHTDPDDGSFFMRLEFETAGLRVDLANLRAEWQLVAREFSMEWRLADSSARHRIAILASKQDHCLQDLLYRNRTGELDGDVVLVVSNHGDVAPIVSHYGIRFELLPVTPEIKDQQEDRLLELLAAARVDLVVLARYMQILSGRVIAAFPSRIINIHHSFLPAFAGAKPYHQAHRRGVKLIGATAHYVTEQLDDGPIIAQATAQVSHRHTTDDLIRKGRDLERTVLASAVRAHLADKVLVRANRTVVFD
jgi:formyltetrahydrofolate deformylase